MIIKMLYYYSGNMNVLLLYTRLIFANISTTTLYRTQNNTSYIFLQTFSYISYVVCIGTHLENIAKFMWQFEQTILAFYFCNFEVVTSTSVRIFVNCFVLWVFVSFSEIEIIDSLHMLAGWMVTMIYEMHFFLVLLDKLTIASTFCFRY